MRQVGASGQVLLSGPAQGAQEGQQEQGAEDVREEDHPGIVRGEVSGPHGSDVPARRAEQEDGLGDGQAEPGGRSGEGSQKPGDAEAEVGHAHLELEGARGPADGGGHLIGEKDVPDPAPDAADPDKEKDEVFEHVFQALGPVRPFFRGRGQAEERPGREQNAAAGIGQGRCGEKRGQGQQEGDGTFHGDPLRFSSRGQRPVPLPGAWVSRSFIALFARGRQVLRPWVNPDRALVRPGGEMFSGPC